MHQARMGGGGNSGAGNDNWEFLASKEITASQSTLFHLKLEWDFCCWSLQKQLEGVCISSKMRLHSSNDLPLLFASVQPVRLWQLPRPPKRFFHWFQFVTPCAELVSSVL